MKQNIIQLENISKMYKIKNKKLNILSNINIIFDEGKFYAIMGSSGSGKSTLINILGLIDKIDGGSYKLYNQDINNLSDRELSHLRMKNIGFVFQDFQLDPNLKAIENVMMPMLINKDITKKERINIATNLLIKLGLKDRINHYPKELSGGEQQRVSIARSLANDPTIILADEPTGNLDEKMEKEIFSNLKTLSNDGKCVIVVSHSKEVKNYADKIYNLYENNLVETVNEGN